VSARLSHPVLREGDCSFCGTSPQQVKIIAGPDGVFICDECADLCTYIVKEGTLPLRTHERSNEARRALAVLLDEVGACARGELPLPERDQLWGWLVLLKWAGTSDARNDGLG